MPCYDRHTLVTTVTRTIYQNDYYRTVPTIANLQSNLKKIYPHKHFKPICIIWSSFDHNSSRNLIKSSKGKFLIFNLDNDQLSSNMNSRIQWHHLDLITWFKRSQVHRIDRWIFQSTVHWEVKLWLFGQNQVPRVIFHQNVSK